MLEVQDSRSGHMLLKMAVCIKGFPDSCLTASSTCEGGNLGGQLETQSGACGQTPPVPAAVGLQLLSCPFHRVSATLEVTSELPISLGCLWDTFPDITQALTNGQS